MKKFLAIVLSAVALVISIFFVGCKKTELIPNGYYGSSSVGQNIYEHIGSDIRDSYGWVIDGDIAEEWVSGSCNYKAKIVEKDGVIYFEGYEWFDFLYSLTSCAPKYEGNSNVYEVTYNETEKSITLILVVVPIYLC